MDAEKTIANIPLVKVNNLIHVLVNHYNAYIAPNRNDFQSSMTGVQLPTVPNVPNTQETLKVAVPQQYSESSETLWIALTAVDDLGAESKISNIVSTRYIAPEEDKIPNWLVFVIIGIVGVVLVTITISVIAYYCRNKPASVAQPAQNA